ncbi:MAG: response regulator, partial [Thermoanaerobaculia bacterium]|nr:response regulator [Thermoanaerobaculia bacterium]
DADVGFEPGRGRVTAATAAAAKNDGHEATILIVDDEPVVRHVLSNQLSQLGYCLLEAGNGPEALELLEAKGPDLVLLDIMMPRMSGFEVCRQIRLTQSLEELPVIYLTAKTQVEDLVQGFATGANDFLTKPIVKEELLARVKTHLELARMYANLEKLVEERTAQVKSLRGLLPICSSCKKIRDDDGYWNELEAFLAQHSEAQLTHALCLDCARQLYPEFAEEL